MQRPKGRDAFLLPRSDSGFFSWPISSIRNCNREEHNRSDAEFKWALDIEGAVDMTESMTLRQISQQFGSRSQARFSFQFESALTVSQIALKKLGYLLTR